jgi:hypothetical protein
MFAVFVPPFVGIGLQKEKKEEEEIVLFYTTLFCRVLTSS